MEHLNTQIISEYTKALGKDVFLQTIDLYEQQAATYFTHLAEAVEKSDYHAWQQHCHIMKSAAGNVGLNSLHQLLGSVEYSKDDFSQLNSELLKMRELHQLSLVELKKWLA